MLRWLKGVFKAQVLKYLLICLLTCFLNSLSMPRRRFQRMKTQSGALFTDAGSRDDSAESEVDDEEAIYSADDDTEQEEEPKDDRGKYQ